jgi:hypothetical protein
MNRLIVLLSSLLLAITVAAQDMPSNQGTTGSQEQSPQTMGRTATSQSSVIRGCLTGSAGNYTLTDQNGMQYKLMGEESALGSKVGHEVEVTGMESQAGERTSDSNDSMAHPANSLEVSQVRDVANSCNLAHPGGPRPSSENLAPQSQTAPPKLMAMLQQQSTPSAGAQQQSNPPASTQSAPTGNSPANNTGMTPNEANRDAQAARQGELNTNPQNGETTGRGVNNQGVNNPTSTSPNAVPNSRETATPQANAPNANDQNKPLYERPATDVPWANHSGANGATTSTPPPQ